MERILLEIVIEDNREVRVEVLGTSTVVDVSSLEGDFKKPLTSREHEVLKLLAVAALEKGGNGNGYVGKVARDLKLSVKTVETHKSNLMRKLDIHNKAQLVQYAIQNEIIWLRGEPVQLEPLAPEPEPEADFVINT